MLTINPRERKLLKFEFDVDGAYKTIDNISMILESNQGFQIKIPAKLVDKKIECELPILEGLVDIGEMSINLECVIDGKYYVPLTEQITIEKPLKIESKIVSDDKVQIKEAVKAPTFKTSLSSSILEELESRVI